jgi:hypothetical protein
MDSSEKRSGGQSEQREKGKVMHVEQDRSPLTDGKVEEIVGWTRWNGKVHLDVKRQRQSKGESRTLWRRSIYANVVKEVIRLG